MPRPYFFTKKKQRASRAIHPRPKARGILAPCPVNPDLVFLDINMPKMNGWVVYEKLRGNPKTKGIPVAILTVRAHPSDVDGGINETGAEIT